MHTKGKKGVTCTQGVRCKGSDGLGSHAHKGGQKGVTHTHTRGKKGVTHTYRVRRGNAHSKGSEIRGSDDRQGVSGRAGHD